MFWLRYLLVAIVGTALVYVAAPPLRERYLSTFDAGEEEPAGDLPAAEEPPDAARPAHGVVPPAKRPPAAKPLRPVVGGTKRNSPAKAPAAPAKTEPPAAPEETEPPAAPPARSVEAIPVSEGGVIRWGVIRHHAAAFKPDGKRIPNKAPGGTLVEITEIVQTTKGDEMARCRMWEGSGWFGPYLVGTVDLLMFEGGRGDVLAEDVGNLLAFYALNASLVARREELEKAALDANPHAARLREMAANYNAKADHAQELTRRRDLAKGAARARIADELRKLEIEAAKDQQALTRQIDLYNKWKEAHPQKAADCDADPRYAAIRREMDALRPRVADFGAEE